MSKFYHGVAMCKGRKFYSEFCTQLFVHISDAFRLSTLIWVLLEFRSFPPHVQKLSIDDANCGQKWWHQKWKAKACHGRHRSQWVKAELQTQKQMQQYKLLLKELQQLHGYIRYWICLTMSSIYRYSFFLSHDLIALLNGNVSKIRLMLHNKYY